MLAFLVRISIRYYGIVIAVAVVLLCYGSYRYAKAGLDIFPEFSPKQVIIQTEAPGFSAQQVETLVTQQIENALGGLIGLQSIRSESIQGLSVVSAVFNADTDIYRNRQGVTERLASLTTKLPPGISTPVPIPLSSSSATILTIGLTSEQQNLMQLRTLVNWTIVPRLMSVPGVADVNVFGGSIKQLQIQLDPLQLQRFNLAVEDIIHSAELAGKSYGGGFLETTNQRFTLQVTGQPSNPEQLKQIIVRRSHGKNITLGDVSNIAYAAAPSIGAAQIQGKPGIVMMVIGQYGANTLTVSKSVEAALHDFSTIFKQQHIDFYSKLFRPADYIETSLHNLQGHLLIGGLFVLIILLLFLFNLRTALISALAIPISLIGAMLVLLETGTNLNIMVLGGLAIALGEVVDDAIIDTENIFRRLRENQQLERPLPITDVVFQASMEVRSSVVYASFIVALVFVPLLTLSGVAGRLFAPLGYAYIIAILMSLIVALTLTPALCYLLLGHQDQNNTEPPVIRFIQPFFRKLLCFINHYFKPILLISLTLFTIGLFTLYKLEGKFLPELREGHYIVHTSSIPGTSLQESIRIGRQLTKQFLDIPGIEFVSQWAGRAERGADTYGSHYSEYEVRLKPADGSRQQAIRNHLRTILDDFPGILFEVNTFLTERVDETISGYTSAVVVNVYGNDFTLLDTKAREVAEIMRRTTGATEVQLRSPPGTNLLEIHLKLDQLAFWGVRPEQVIDTLQAAYETRVVGKNLQGNRQFDIAVALAPELRTQPDAIGQLPVRTLDGALLPLQQLADIRQVTGRYNILHQNAQRKQTVTCNIIDRDLEGFVKELQTRVFQKINFGAEMYAEFTGEAQERAQVREDLIVHALLAGVGVLILIFIAIGNFRNTLLTLTNLPFALLGGVAAVVLTGSTLSVGSMVGFVTLFGITVRNSIMLLSHYRYLIRIKKKRWGLETMIQGAQERLPAILMTALVTALAMFPIAFDSDNPGREIMGPMAAIIIGGLATSTLLNLLLLPIILLRYGHFTRPRLPETK